ncbi:Tn3 family transposase [Niveispirillum sp.]|uniref:Tn3 family transposase n=1 Tax=Niveispirillum sp. TaxID=1917217 RepID=UPI001B415360|nr:Tn3 family transposase [Niveispirillum sp.]MBP7339724.1 Tn3 family transposase [Niveispirillum sp.]
MLALRELGRVERTIFTLDWLRDPALCRRTNAGLNKGVAPLEVRNGPTAPLIRAIPQRHSQICLCYIKR